MNQINKSQSTDALGVKILKDFHLKHANSFDKDIKDKIFFIG